MKIAMITDGNGKLGMGHVYQTMVLSERLRAQAPRDAQIRLMTKSGDAVAGLLRTTGLDVSQHEDDESLFEALRAQSPDRVIIDKLDVEPDFARRISEQLGAKLVILTNLTDANEHADVTVMAGMGSGFKNLRKRTAAGQLQFWGPRYWLLRPEFFAFGRKPAGPIRRLILIFGGSDQANLSSRVLDELLGMDEAFEVTVVLGAAFAHRAELQAVLAAHARSASTVQVVDNLQAVAQAMHDSDLAFVSPGLSFFEALAVGTPVLCFHQNEFQREAWSGYIQTHDKDDVGQLRTLIANRSFIRPEDPDILAMEVGTGIDEIVAEILQ